MAPTTTASNSGAKRFELPALNFNFSSLTEGTDIPPPPDSPVEKAHTPPKTPPVAAEKKEADPKPNGAATTKAANGSPTTSAPKAEGETQSIGTAPSVRPASRSNGSIFDEKKAKRGSGFFRRLRSSDKPSSNLYQHANGSQTKPEVRGPPPPMIPELSALESKLDVNDGGSLGDDLFKNIK